VVVSGIHGERRALQWRRSTPSARALAATRGGVATAPGADPAPEHVREPNLTRCAERWVPERAIARSISRS